MPTLRTARLVLRDWCDDDLAPFAALNRGALLAQGLVHDPTGDFEHPLVPEGHPLRRHVLYRWAGR